MMLRTALAALLVLLPVAADAATRIKDIASIKGLRSNQLVGYGLVIGLNGTGDSLRNSNFTQQSVQSLLDRMGVNIRNGQTRTRNVAAVIVTTEMPAFIGRGARVDVNVSSLGDATSLAGGTLVMTPLSGADDVIYAVGQGPVAVTGFASKGASESVTQGVPTSGRVPNGALIERDAPGTFYEQGQIELELRNPDFKTAIRVVDAINFYADERFGAKVAREHDFRTIRLSKPASIPPARFIAEVTDLMVEPDSPARIVIDERTGTIVIGQNVQVSTVGVAHGNLTVRVTETPNVSQPSPFSKGETVVTSDTDVAVAEAGGSVVVVRGTDLQKLVSGLNRMGLKPQGIIAILQAIKSAGALQAELVVQ